MLKRLQAVQQVISDYGWLAAADIAIGLVKNKTDCDVRVKSLMQPVHLRWRSSDRLVLHQIVSRKEALWPGLKNASLILDVGANTGFSAIMYAHQCPKAMVIAVEPEPGYATILRCNAARYKCISVVERAIWHEDTELQLVNESAESWAFQYSPTSDSKLTEGSKTVPTVTIDELTKQHTGRFDLLKVDIEGAEIELFSKGKRGWIARTDRILVEPHDRFRDGCSAAIRGALAQTHREHEQQGEFLAFQHISCKS